MMGPEKRCVLALDQGTTSSRAILFDASGLPLAMAQEAFPQHTKPLADGGSGGDLDQAIVEHDPEDLWRTQLGCATRCLADAGVRPQEVAAVGITNQRETTILWDRVTGRAVAPAVVWQSRVSAAICERLKAAGHEPEIRRRTGLLLDPYFSATKIVHLFETHPGLRERCTAGEVLFGTVDSFLIWRLTGGRVHATDVTNASRTLLYDITAGGWSDELLRLFDLPRQMLPEVRPSAAFFGDVDERWLGAAIPIAGCAGDQQASAFAHGCHQPGDAKTTYGTGAFLLESTGPKPVLEAPGLLATPACTTADRSAAHTYCLEGSVFVAGAIVGWLRDGLGLIERSGDIEPLARSVPDAGGVMLVPALAGLGTPHWDPFARGLIIGLTRGTGRGQIARAALDAIALSVADVIGGLEQASGCRLARMRVDGGACVNDLLMQIQADVLGIPVDRPAVLETTALGAAMLAGLTTGFYSAPAEVAAALAIERSFEPLLDSAARDRLLDRWRNAVDRSRGWARPTTG